MSVLHIYICSIKCFCLLLSCDLRYTYYTVCVHLHNLCKLYFVTVCLYNYMHMPICNSMHIGSSIQTSSLLTHIVCIYNLFTQLCVATSVLLFCISFLILSTCSICYIHSCMHIDTIICSILSYVLWYCLFVRCHLCTFCGIDSCSRYTYICISMHIYRMQYF